MEHQPSSKRAWLYVGLWVLFIYLTIPIARRLQEFIRDHGGKVVFLYITYAAFAIGAIAAFRNLVRQRKRLSPIRAGLLIVILGIFSYLSWTLRANPEEALHFVQYGVLGLLVFRAFSFRLRDPAIYIASFMVGAFFGILDEMIQWVVPRRFFDYRDIGINVFAGLLVQCALAFAIQPEGITGKMTPRGLRITLRIGMANLLLIACCVNHTPQVMEGFEERVGKAKWLVSSMAEYGYRHVDDEIGSFKSRLTLEEIKQQDRDSYEEVIPSLHKSMGHGYTRFIRSTPGHKHPLLYEARIHLFRRDYYALKFVDPEFAGDRAFNATVAWYENRIMEKYFPNTLENSRYRWDEEKRVIFDQHAEKHANYDSPVSRSLITVVSQRTLNIILGGLMVVMALSIVRLKRKVEEDE